MVVILIDGFRSDATNERAASRESFSVLVVLAVLPFAFGPESRRDVRPPHLARKGLASGWCATPSEMAAFACFDDHVRLKSGSAIKSLSPENHQKPLNINGAAVGTRTPNLLIRSQHFYSVVEFLGQFSGKFTP